MGKTSQLQCQKNDTSNSRGSSRSRSGKTNPTSTKAKRTRKTVPRDSPPQRSSIYRGVTRHRWTGRYEAHLWDKNCWNESHNKKGRQVYLGAYDDEEAAAHVYDLAALKYWGPDTILNFPLSTYDEELRGMEGQSKEEYIGSLRRKSSGFSRGVSKYRGVARHHHNGRWEARIGRVFGNKYLYLGTYATQEEAATAYDVAAIEYRGLNAVTNFDLSRYTKCLRPNSPNNIAQKSPNDDEYDANPINNIDEKLNLGFTSQQQISPNANIETKVPNSMISTESSGSDNAASSTLGFLMQSSKFKEMLERTSAADCPSTLPESDVPRRSFPDDIQTYFADCQDSGGYTEGDDLIFGDLISFGSPIFYCELDC